MKVQTELTYTEKTSPPPEFEPKPNYKQLKEVLKFISWVLCIPSISGKDHQSIADALKDRVRLIDKYQHDMFGEYMENNHI